MRNYIILLVLSVGVISTLSAQSSVEGVWLTEGGQMKVEIYKKDGLCYGKVAWLEEPNDSKGEPLKDVKNPDESLRSRPLMGMELFSRLTEKDGKWIGTMYAPKRGITLDIELQLSNQDELEVDVEFRRFSKEQTWTRTTL